MLWMACESSSRTSGCRHCSSRSASRRSRRCSARPSGTRAARSDASSEGRACGVCSAVVRPNTEGAVMPRITVVNDNEAFLELVRDILEDDRYEVTTIDGDRPDALARIKASRPDVLMIDLRFGAEG